MSATAPPAKTGAAAPPRPPMRGGGGGPFGGMGGMPVQKAMRFGPSAKRLLGRLRPDRAAVALVLVLGVSAVVLSVIGPKLLGQATNLIFGGVLGRQLPAGATKAQVLAQLDATGRSAQADLLRRLLPRDVEHRQPLAGERSTRLERQRRLADARIAAHEDDGALHEAAAEHAVELAEAGRAADGFAGRHRGEGTRRGGLRDARAPPALARRGHGLLDQRVPRVAAGALAEPARGRVAALLADERRPPRFVNHGTRHG